MILSRANLETVQVAGDKSDAALAQVRVEPDGTTVAGDGRAMMVVEGLASRPKTFPDVRTEVPVPEEGLGLPADLAVEALRTMPKGGVGLGLGYAALTRPQGGPEEGGVALTTTDLRGFRSMERGAPRKRFPEWRGILHGAGQGGGRVCVDRKALIRLLGAMDAACQGAETALFLEMGGEGEGLVLRGVNVVTGQRVIGLTMPMDTKGQWFRVNAWERRTLGRSVGRRPA